MNASIAMLLLFVIRLAAPIVVLFIFEEWLSKREDGLAFPEKN